jgi:hypothetical protein
MDKTDRKTFRRAATGRLHRLAGCILSQSERVGNSMLEFLLLTMSITGGLLYANLVRLMKAALQLDRNRRG